MTIPERLELIPDGQKVVESFGWQPGIYGLLFIVVACIFPLLENHDPILIENAILGVIGLAGFGLLYYELSRRRNKAVLVRDGNGIAVFRKSRFAYAAPIAKIEIHEMPLATLVQILVPVLALAAIFLLFAATEDMGLTKGFRMLDAIAGLALIASALSLIWTRFFCISLLFPGRKRRFFLETILIRPFQRSKLW